MSLHACGSGRDIGWPRAESRAGSHADAMYTNGAIAPLIYESCIRHHTHTPSHIYNTPTHGRILMVLEHHQHTTHVTHPSYCTPPPTYHIHNRHTHRHIHNTTRSPAPPTPATTPARLAPCTTPAVGTHYNGQFMTDPTSHRHPSRAALVWPTPRRPPS